MSEVKHLTQQVDEINARLRTFGSAAVQEIKMVKDGKVIGQVRYGYKPQYVFDAVNSVLLPENWRYEVLSKEIYESQVVAEVQLFIRVSSGEWFCKGSQTGQMQIVKGNVGDSYKGAITDAIQKCLSLLSIGTDAYRGLLQDVYLRGANSIPHLPEQQKEQSEGKSSQSNNEDTHDNFDLPKIAGITYQHRDGIVVAVGKSFDKKDLLKSAGFRWSNTDKNWYKEIVLH